MDDVSKLTISRCYIKHIILLIFDKEHFLKSNIQFSGIVFLQFLKLLWVYVYLTLIIPVCVYTMYMCITHTYIRARAYVVYSLACVAG